MHFCIYSRTKVCLTVCLLLLHSKGSYLENVLFKPRKEKAVKIIK